MKDNDTTQAEKLPQVQLIPIKESWTCPNEQCGVQNVVFAYERANGDKPSYADCSNCGVKVELGIPRAAASAGVEQAQAVRDLFVLMTKHNGEWKFNSFSGDWLRLQEVLARLAASSTSAEEKCAECGHSDGVDRSGQCMHRLDVPADTVAVWDDNHCGHRCSRPAPPTSSGSVEMRLRAAAAELYDLLPLEVYERVIKRLTEAAEGRTR